MTWKALVVSCSKVSASIQWNVRAAISYNSYAHIKRKHDCIKFIRFLRTSTVTVHYIKQYTWIERSKDSPLANFMGVRVCVCVNNTSTISFTHSFTAVIFQHGKLLSRTLIIIIIQKMPEISIWIKVILGHSKIGLLRLDGNRIIGRLPFIAHYVHTITLLALFGRRIHTTPSHSIFYSRSVLV